MRSFKNTTRVTTLALLAAVSACSGSRGGDKSQVVATVNGAEITVSQLRTALLSKGEAQPTAQTTQQALDGLVNEQLLVDAALANKLDRDPTVVQALEAARRQFLARAYMERSVFPKQEITAVEQTAYYKANSALFAHRRVYQLAAFNTALVQVPAAVVADLAKATTPEAVAEALGAHQIVFETQVLTRAAEQLPLEQLPQFAAAGTGDLVITQQRGRSTLTLITGMQEAPLGFDAAQPIIQQYLENVRNAKALDAHLKQVRASASIGQSDAGLVAAASVPPPAPEAPVQQSALDHGAAVLN